MDRREATEILLNIRNPPGYFENIVSRADDWVGVFSFNLDSPRWNALMPVPGEGLEAPEKVPEELKKLAGDLDRKPCLYGEKEWIKEVAGKMSGEFEELYEMTYLVPEDLPDSGELPDLEFRKVGDSEEEKKAFLSVFENAFGEEQENGERKAEEDMMTGIRGLIEKEWFGKVQEFYIAYRNGEAVATGSFNVKNGKAYLYNVGTHVDHRGESYGTAMTVKLVDEALKYDLGKDDVFIGTQPNTGVEKFYRKIGCREVFKAKAMGNDELLE